MHVINKKTLNALLHMSKQHQAQLIGMVQTMLNAAEDNIALLQQHYLQQQFAQMQPLLHKIRGSFATLGAEQLAAEAKQLELKIEHNNPISDDDFHAVVTLYRQTCSAISDELTTCSVTSKADTAALDLPKLHSLLLRQDMQASVAVDASRQALTTMLGEIDAERFFQFVNNLSFKDAASVIQPHLPQSTQLP